MARIEVDPNYNSPTFSRATAATDVFKKEDVQNLAAAVSTHDHTNGKGAALVAGSIPAGSITSAMIADGTIDTADLKDSAVTSAKIADGTIATADLANSAVTNIKLASDTARLNLLTNGGFEIWQRGNGPFSANGAWTADRWQIATNGTDALSVSKQSNTGLPCSSWCAGFSYTKGTGNLSYLNQNLVIVDVGGLRGATVSGTCSVLSTVVGTVRIQVSANGTGAPVAQSPLNSTGAWETLRTGPITVPSDATLLIFYILFANTTCNGYIDNAMLVVGSVAADYAPLHPADDLARCLRYYEVTDGLFFSALSYATGPLGAWATPVRFKAIKAVSPTVTKVGTWAVQNSAQPGTSDLSVGGFTLTMSCTAIGQAFVSSGVGGNSITAESNP